MKKRSFITKIAVVLFVLTALNACKKDFLNVNPKGKLIASKTAEYDLMFNWGAIRIGLPTSAVIMGDDAIVADPLYAKATLRTQRFFRWEDEVYEPEDNATEMSLLMPKIYIYNKVINEVMDSEGGSQQQKAELQAEAYANRAWSYFMLINYFGLPYNETTSKTDPGYPIITAADVAETKFTRASVAEVYDFIIDDLKKAIAGLPPQSAARVRMSKAAAEAILAKVYVFMGRYTEGLTQISNAFTHLPTNFVVKLYDYNVTLATGGTWGYNVTTTPKAYLSGVPSGDLHEETLLDRGFNNSWSLNGADILLAPEVVALYTANDTRLKLFSSQPYGGGTILSPNPPGAPAPMRAIGFYNTQYGVRLAEMYLLSAECKARTGDIGGAVTDLEALRKKRMPATSATVSITDKDALIRFIIDERTRELSMQGYRWFDMRRLYKDPLFAGKMPYTHKYVSATGAVTTYTLKPERFAIRFPQSVINANPGMKNN
ncbi:RagB/SusD family nutrient uptake outer membrane protein [Pedobacter heparinus]|uniref:RagB/SusD domain protein n=1 Tax=Pedobacter heparinus (strain ATCC 13125 / DSM 2366 / CIP 104194 / JCM 7457 / NBRC 12017 / NCIMB 9290 / NRRL B-14731 / HIM 762-3) TaxID=485917 RepID=C6XXM9_PEDHD|nr:RagB/SusD family nutrient uptake outer membrane protein [Pedobacter heparinus]ACU02283.1 RagB/SusD domain protein [Pedobacter heparinus DSM 2366]